MIDAVSNVVFWILEAAALGTAAYAVVTAMRLVGAFARPPAPERPDERPPVSVIVHLRGADAGLERRLQALLRATRAGDELLLAVATIHDTAHAVCDAFARRASDHGRADVRVVLASRSAQRDGAASPLEAAMAGARHALLAVVDRAALPEPRHLDEGAVAAAADDAGVVFALPYRSGRAPLGGALEALYHNHYRGLYLGAAALHRAPDAVLAGCWMVSRRALEAVGGPALVAGDRPAEQAVADALVAAGRPPLLLRRPLRLAIHRLSTARAVRDVSEDLAVLRSRGWTPFLAAAALRHPAAWALLATLWAALGAGGSVGAGVFVLLVAGAARSAAVALANADVYPAEAPGRYTLLAPLFDACVAPVLLVRQAWPARAAPGARTDRRRQEGRGSDPTLTNDGTSTAF